MEVLKPGHPLFAIVECKECEGWYKVYKYEFSKVEGHKKIYYQVYCPCCHSLIENDDFNLDWKRDHGEE